MGSGVRVIACALGLSAACAACDGGKVITLGAEMPAPYHFGPAQVVSEIAAPADRTDNPTLTGDLLEIYFTSDRGGNGDLWFARRSSAASPFGAPATVAELNTDGFETSAAISRDGLTLWFGSDRTGGVGGIDVWVSTRANRTASWTAPLNVASINSSADDIPRPPGLRETTMPMASSRDIVGGYQTYFARRTGRGAPFDKPVIASGVMFPDRSTVDAFLSDDGLTIFYSSAAFPGADAGTATSDLYVAWRRTVSEPFAMNMPLNDLNSPAEERDPWLTPDGKTNYITSDRDGPVLRYTAAVLPR
jgi:hypothetical protein